MRTVLRSDNDVKARRARVMDLMSLSFGKLEMALKLQLAKQQPEAKLVGHCPVGYRAQVKQNPRLQVSSSAESSNTTGAWPS